MSLRSSGSAEGAIRLGASHRAEGREAAAHEDEVMRRIDVPPLFGRALGAPQLGEQGREH